MCPHNILHQASSSWFPHPVHALRRLSSRFHVDLARIYILPGKHPALPVRIARKGKRLRIALLREFPHLRNHFITKKAVMIMNTTIPCPIVATYTSGRVKVSALTIFTPLFLFENDDKYFASRYDADTSKRACH
jgi:hypothetical protein